MSPANRKAKHLPDTTRRRLLHALPAALALPWTAGGARGPAPRIAIVGAGFGGSTCAGWLRRLLPAAAITLIDARPHWYTGPFTNLAAAGGLGLDSIRRETAWIGRQHGVRTRIDRVIALDPVRRRLRLAGGERIDADHVVIAPGVALRWDGIEGLDAEVSGQMPHAWTGGIQVELLRARLAAVPDGGTLVIGAPANPYRCPPGPYERASLIADALRLSGRRRCKIVIADAKDDFTKRALFLAEWDERYGAMIEWLPRAKGGEVVRVDPGTGEVWLRGERRPIVTALASIIPAQTAAALAIDADLADASGWCPVDPGSFESLRHPGVWVLGDATAAAPMPKSAFSANSQAKLAAAAIAARIDGRPAPTPRLLSTCYSLVSHDAAISVSGYYTGAQQRMAVLSEGVSPMDPPDGQRQREYRQAHDWYESITTDSFGARRRL